LTWRSWAASSSPRFHLHRDRDGQMFVLFVIGSALEDRIPNRAFAAEWRHR
jgi:hypothetical protein